MDTRTHRTFESVQNHDRRSRLLELIRVRGFAALEELVRELGVSESTIRRDLDALEEQGAARRTHGGVLYAGGMPRLAEFDDRQPANWAAKRAIAARAADLIADGETVLLDGGTTTYEVARLLVGRSLQVVTNSLPVANLLSGCGSIELVLIGGCVDHRTGVTIGPMADGLLASLRVDKAFLSVAGVDEEGYYNSNLLLVETEKMMSRIAAITCIAADSSKFGRASLSRLCGLGEVQWVISDKQLPSSWQKKLQTLSVDLTLADAI